MAILVFGAGGPMISDATGSGRTGYLVMAVVCAAVIGGAMLIAALGVGRAATPLSQPQAATSGAIPAGWAALRESAPLRALLGAFIARTLLFVLATAVLTLMIAVPGWWMYLAVGLPMWPTPVCSFTRWPCCRMLSQLTLPKRANVLV